MLPLFRSCESRIISKIERLLALTRSVNQHLEVQHNPPPRPIYSDNLLNRNPQTPSSVHSVTLVQVVQPQGVPSAGLVKPQRKGRGGLVLSTSPLSNQPRSRQRAALDLSTSHNSLRILACLGAVMHLDPKINR